MWELHVIFENSVFGEVITSVCNQPEKGSRWWWSSRYHVALANQRFDFESFQSRDLIDWSFAVLTATKSKVDMMRISKKSWGGNLTLLMKILILQQSRQTLISTTSWHWEQMGSEIQILQRESLLQFFLLENGLLSYIKNRIWAIHYFVRTRDLGVC